MNVGKLNKLLTLQKIGGTNAYGESATWTDVKTCWADFAPNQAPTEFSTHTATMRYNSQIDQSCRFLYKGRIFKVVLPVVNHDEKNVYMKVNLKEEINRTV